MASSAVFNIYGALNDFLPVSRKNLPWVYFFLGNPGLKDAIEAIGPPHTEVAAIVVNGSYSGWEVKLQDRNVVDVYPKSHPFSLNALLQPEPTGSRFISDGHLGKLTRNLRMTGFDTYYRSDLSDKAIAEIAQTESRIILTRDVGLLKLKTVKWGYWLRSQNPDIQLKEVVSYYNLKEKIVPFSRCLDCNGVLSPIEKSKVIDELRPKTILYFNEFYQCIGCRKVYWKGSHYQRMQDRLKKIIG